LKEDICTTARRMSSRESLREKRGLQERGVDSLRGASEEFFSKRGRKYRTASRSVIHREIQLKRKGWGLERKRTSSGPMTRKKQRMGLFERNIPKCN